MESGFDKKWTQNPLKKPQKIPNPILMSRHNMYSNLKIINTSISVISLDLECSNTFSSQVVKYRRFVNTPNCVGFSLYRCLRCCTLTEKLAVAPWELHRFLFAEPLKHCVDYSAFKCHCGFISCH